MSQAASLPVVLSAQGLALSYAGRDVFKDLSFELRPGLTLVRGGDGRGKTGLLRMMAGVMAPSAGALWRQSQTIYWVDPVDPADDTLTAVQWLKARREASLRWDSAMARRSIDVLALAEHLGKSLLMLSTGTRRKVWLAAALACGAELVLLDMPFAALDARSSRELAVLLTEMAAQTRQAWVIADYDLPDGVSGQGLAGVIDLGD